jgi:hypothetical protein
MESKLEKIIDILRQLREDSSPTMSTASTVGKAGFGGSPQGFDPGPTAGYDKPFDGRSRIARRLPPPYKKAIQKTKK